MRRLEVRGPATGKTVNGPHDGFSAGGPRDREATPHRFATKYLLSVYAGQRCLGFLLSRRDGVEAFDIDDRSLGIFPDQKSAADAISKPQVEARRGRVMAPG